MSDLKLNIWLFKKRYEHGLPVQIYAIDTLADVQDSSSIEKIADSMFYEHRIFASGIGDFNFPAIALATEETLPKTISIRGEIGHVISLKEVNYMLDPKIENHRRAIGGIFSRMLRSRIYSELGKTLWQRSSQSRIYCSLEPESFPSKSQGASTADCELYRGFRYRIDVFEDGKVGLSIDLHSTILDKLSLAERIEEYGIDSFPSNFKNQYMVLADADGKLKVRFVKDILLNKTISTFKIENKYGGSISVFDSFKGKNSKTNSPLCKEDYVILFSYYSESTQEQLYAPASCFYDILINAEIEEDSHLKQLVIIPPEKRLPSIVTYYNILKKHASDESYGPNYDITFESQLCGGPEFKCGIIDLPILKFGNEGLLDPIKLDDKNKWNFAKDSSLKKHGMFRHSNIDSIIIIHPQMNNNILLDFYEDLCNTAKQWNEKLPKTFTPRQTLDYLDILSDIEKYQDRFDAAIIVFKEWNEENYDRMKKALRIPSQGVMLSTIYSKKRLEEKGRIGNYNNTLTNILSGLLVKSGALPWVMGSPLSCDCYIGVDSGGSKSRVWSYAYLFDNIGALVGSERGQAYKKESIEKERFKNSIIQAIQKYPGEKGPKRIVIHRDGRLTQTEREGLQESLIELQNNDMLERDIDCAAVDIKKSHSLRIFEHGDAGFQNPFIGSYFALDNQRALLATTGEPVLAQGTANPLLLEMDVIQGKIALNEVIKDIFYLSELNWGAPKMNIKMPITIRFAEKRIFYADKGIDYVGQIPV